ncbi:pilus assembly protein [Actinoplanes bogorensis]|uniref:Pilus assembly protein n=1 Tax=Paractinoplanes bogorensis TaxID=1610840 RepID=A0ABS5YMB0_9ACTN|nr:TadE/TadG family type IV pilus assembly protein [Actinoplanes bogorensis]MBU2664191.1 pilus assembly protein [Actinoplanes bogorensis]
METAIVMPLILLMLFGIIDFGRALQQQTQLTAAVREGARTGALNGTSAQVQAKVTAVANTGATISYTTLTLCGGTSADAVVTAKQTFTALTPIFSIMALFNQTASISSLTATGVMACTG